MKLTKAKYLLFSSAIIAVAVFTLLGSANVIISAAKFAFADDLIPVQETCRYYDGNSTYGTEFSGVNTLNKNVSRNYILNACSVNLAGYNLTGKYDNGPVIEAYSMSFISGAGGTIAPKTGSAEPTIMITSNGIVQVSNVSLSTPAGYTADVITNNGTATLNEVTTAGNITNNNTMIINSGIYTGGTYGTSRIGSYYSGSLTINGGTFSNTIDGGAGNAVIINDGNFAGAQINAPFPQINGGTFSNAAINTDATITGGIFTDGTTIASGSTISGGSFDNTVSISSGVTITGGTFATAPSPSQVPAGKKVIQNADGSYSVVDDPDSGDSGGDDSGDDSGGDSGGGGSGDNNSGNGDNGGGSNNGDSNNGGSSNNDSNTSGGSSSNASGDSNTSSGSSTSSDSSSNSSSSTTSGTKNSSLQAPDTGLLEKLHQSSAAEITISGTLAITAAILSLCTYLLFRLHKLYRIRH